jgi:methyl-accepting chemotaxis protein
MTPWWISCLISIGVAAGSVIVSMLVQSAVMAAKLAAQEQSYVTANLALEKLLSQRSDDIEKMCLRRFQTLEEDAGHGAQDLKDAAKELHQVVTELTALAREQAVVNTMMTKTLESLTSKIEAHDRLITEHGAAIQILHEKANSVLRQSYERAGDKQVRSGDKS